MKKTIKYIVITLIGFPMFYFIFAFVLGHTPVNNDFKPDATGVEIFVKSNGAHTDFVIPITNSDYNWNEFVSVQQTLRKDTNAKYVSFGWGDKGFFLETLEWKDLKFSVAFKAVFALSSSAMHVSYRNSKPQVGELCKSVMISHEQYKLLIAYIQGSFTKSADGKIILIPNAHYHDTDAFYEANGTYHLFKTCNEWTRKGMSKTGIKCSSWSVLDKSVLRFIE